MNKDIKEPSGAFAEGAQAVKEKPDIPDATTVEIDKIDAAIQYIEVRDSEFEAIPSGKLFLEEMIDFAGDENVEILMTTHKGEGIILVPNARRCGSMAALLLGGAVEEKYGEDFFGISIIEGMDLKEKCEQAQQAATPLQPEPQG